METPSGTPYCAASRASIRSAPGADRLHMPIGAMPKGLSAGCPEHTGRQ